MKDAIGKERTREDHADVNSQLLASYSSSLEVRDLISIVGEDGLNFDQKRLLKFSNEFEQKFMNQKSNENRSFDETLTLAWDVLSNLNKNQLLRIHQYYIDKHYQLRV